MPRFQNSASGPGCAASPTRSKVKRTNKNHHRTPVQPDPILEEWNAGRMVAQVQVKPPAGRVCCRWANLTSQGEGENPKLRSVKRLLHRETIRIAPPSTDRESPLQPAENPNPRAKTYTERPAVHMATNQEGKPHKLTRKAIINQQNIK